MERALQWVTNSLRRTDRRQRLLIAQLAQVALIVFTSVCT